MTPAAPDAGPPAIALVTFNSRPDLERCFAAQLETARWLDAPVVVVDNASGDATLAFLAERRRTEPRIEIVALPENRGYAAAVNEAFARAPDRDLMLVNPDVELGDPSAVEALMRVLAAHPRVAVAGPRLVGSDGHVQASARRFPSLLTLLGDRPPFDRLPAARRSHELYSRPSEATEPCTVDWVIGGAMLIRRDAFERVGGWDPGYFLYVEDMDFCRRCIGAGWEIAYVPTVSLVHRYERASSFDKGSARSSTVRRRHIRSHLRHFVRAPALAFGGCRTRSRPLARPGPLSDDTPGADAREREPVRGG